MLQRKRDWNASIRESKQLYVPLKQVNVEATIRSFAADVTITQVFGNNEAVPIEAVYCFPIEKQAAVYAFIARIDDREIVAQLKEKKQAQQEYNDAFREHHGAYMLEQDEESQDNFIINVGALPPNKECYITISYVTELELVENGTKIRFVIPTTIAPRYNPNKGSIDSLASTTTEYVQSAPYTIEFHCRVEKVGISRVSSISHPIQVDLNQDDFYMIEFSQENIHLDRDIMVDIELTENRSNTIIAVEPGAIMASFTPTEQNCQLAMNNVNITNEFIFVVDCSGSMNDENKIGLVRQAMLLFLKSLPINCHFNIIRFGSEHKSLFNDVTVIYNEDNARQAEQLIHDMKADLGGTELLRPLQWLVEHPPTQGYARQIFLLSDGEISNVDQVLDLCRSMSKSARIFSFGLGHSPSRALIKGLASTTNGCFVFIPPSTNVDIYVLEQLRKALQPCFTNIKINWNLNSTPLYVVPTNAPPIFINDRLIVYAILDDKSTLFDHNVSVELYSEPNRLGEAKVNRIPSVSNNGMIARLAAKALILELQHSKLPSSIEKDVTKETIKKHIVDISLKHNILSPYTAFIGIEKRVNANNADMILREVPIQISADNQYLKYLEMHISEMHHNQARKSRMHEYDEYHRAQCCYKMVQHNFSEVQHNFSVAQQLYDRAEQHRDEAKQRYHEAQQRYHEAQQLLKLSENAKESSPQDYEEAQHNYSKAQCRYREVQQRHYEAVQRYHEAQQRCNQEMLFHKMQYKMAQASLYNDVDEDLSSDIDYARALQRYEHEKRSLKQSKVIARNDDQKDQDVIRQVISEQKFDGLWDVDTKIIKQLTGKSLSDFQQLENTEMLVSAIIVVVLETRFASLSSMWCGVIQKARKHLLNMLGNDNNKLDTLLEKIRKQI